MSLNSLFEDRKLRKFIRESVNEAVEIGKGDCSLCGNNAFLMNAFNKNICESCLKGILDKADDYEINFNENTYESVLGLESDSINEAYLLLDLKKLEKDATADGKDISSYVKGKYNFPLPNSSIESAKGRIYVDNNAVITKGNSKINQFIIDYNAQFSTIQAGKILVADPDGTLAPVIVGDKVIRDENNNYLVDVSNVKAAAPRVGSAKATAKSVSAPVAGAGSVQTEDGKRVMKLSSKNVISITGIPADSDKKSYIVKLEFAGEQCNLNVKSDVWDDDKKLAITIKEQLVSNPGAIFPSFKENGSAEVEVDNFGTNKFAFDTDSFNGKIYMVPVRDGKKINKEKVMLSDKALTSRAVLNAELNEWVDDRINNMVPILKNRSLLLKTSIGPALITLVNVKNSNVNADCVFTIELANKSNKNEIVINSGELSNDKVAKEKFYQAVCDSFTEMFDGFAKLVTKQRDGYEYVQNKFLVDDKKDVVLKAKMDINTFLDKGEVIFNVTVKDGKKEESDKVRITNIGKFENTVQGKAKEIYEKEFKANDGLKLRDTATEKIKSPTKKIALMDKICQMNVKDYSLEIGVKSLLDLVWDLDINVKTDGTVVGGTLTVIDADGIYNSLDDFEKVMKNIPKTFSTGLKLVKKAESGEGKKVIFKVTDVKKFYNDFRLDIFESEIFEVFGIEKIEG